MDEKQFDALVTRFASGSSRRDSVKALLAAALATVGVSSLAEARKGKGKDRKGKGGRGAGIIRGRTRRERPKASMAKARSNLRRQKLLCLAGAERRGCHETTGIDCEYRGRSKEGPPQNQGTVPLQLPSPSGSMYEHRRDNDNAAGDDHVAASDDHVLGRRPRPWR